MIELTPLETCPDLKNPRRLMRYVLIWCSEGEAMLVVDEHEFVLAKHQLITITSGQVHFLKSCKGAKGRVLEFTYDFFCKTDADIELIFHNGLFCHFAMNEVITVKDSVAVGLQRCRGSVNLTCFPQHCLFFVRSARDTFAAY